MLYLLHSQPPKSITMIFFLTSNAQKSDDFKKFGFSVREFPNENMEIRSPCVEEVALHKAFDTGLNNIVVEDTSLHVEGAKFFGTEIKHVYHEIRQGDKYHYHDAIWKIALCAKKDDNFYLATGEINGKIILPPSYNGYNFEKFFAIKQNEKYVHFGDLNKADRFSFNPRFKALMMLSKALENDDYSSLKCIPLNTVKKWSGEYQIELKPASLPKRKP